MRRRLYRLLWLALLLLPTGAPAQAGSIEGVVVESRTLLPLPGVRVVLQPAPDGVVATGSRALALSRATSTDAEGGYRFAGLPPGEYRVHLQALGYWPATVEVRLGGGDASLLSVGLRVAPVRLEPLEVRAGTADRLAASPGAAEGAEARVVEEQRRQERFPGSDTRSLTRADTEEALTLVETDLFRALQRSAGVTTRDEYSAEMWTRGAPWDQTAVHFDGVPLFNPLHAAGAFSGVNGDAVGAAFFHPGVEPAELGGGGAGVVDIRSRRGSEARAGASAELSLLSGRMAMDGPLGDRGTVMVAARRTHLDLLARLADGFGAQEEVPYAFGDLTARLDLRLGDGWVAEASGMLTRDRLWGDVDELVSGTEASWGSGVGRLTLARRLAAGEARQSFGWSGFSARSSERGPPPAAEGCGCEPPQLTGPFYADATRNGIGYWFAAGSLEHPAPEGGVTWAAGYRLSTLAARHTLQGTWPFRSDAARAVRGDATLRQATLWGEAGWRPLPEMRVRAGVRVEGGPGVHLAPRLSTRYDLGSGLSVSAAAGRRYQYAQAVTPAGPGRASVAMSNLVWALAGDSLPALRADLFTVGAEQWIGGAALASVTAFRRSTRGAALPDPRPGWMMDRPLSVPADGEALGLDFGVRRLAGAWTGSFQYSFALAEVEARGHRFPAPTAREHSLDATLLARAGRRVRLGAAYTGASGAAFTRYEGGLRFCTAPSAASCRFVAYARDPGAERSPDYRSLDLLADWSGAVRGWRLGGWVRLHNVLGRRNAAAYQWSRSVCNLDDGRCGDPILDPSPASFDPVNHRFLPGLPFFPAIGFRAAF